MDVAVPPTFSNSRFPLFPPATSPERGQWIVRSSAPTDEQGRYWHWDKLKDLEPPRDWSIEEWWAGMKWARTRQSRNLPFVGKSGAAFMLVTPPCIRTQLHWLERNLRRRNPASGDDSDRSLLSKDVGATEAACSCALDGVVDKKNLSVSFLREGGRPRDNGEGAIADNFQALEFIRDRIGDDLSPELLLELHRFLTSHSATDSSLIGRFRTEEDRFGGWGSGLWHEPPAGNELPERVFRLCSFADSYAGIEVSFHPMVSSVLLHFMVLYDQPFVMANGRLARALFYWNMLKNGYELVDLLSISQVLMSVGTQYERSFRYVVTDGNDAAYFVIFQLDVLAKAFRRLENIGVPQNRQ